MSTVCQFDWHKVCTSQVVDAILMGVCPIKTETWVCQSEQQILLSLSCTQPQSSALGETGDTFEEIFFSAPLLPTWQKRKCHQVWDKSNSCSLQKCAVFFRITCFAHSESDLKCHVPAPYSTAAFELLKLSTHKLMSILSFIGMFSLLMTVRKIFFQAIFTECFVKSCQWGKGNKV